MKGLLLLFIISISSIHAFAQPCTTLGQTPETAFPVCGTSVFHQNNVPLCNTNSLFVPGCTGGGQGNYENKNPFYYKFTCFQSGTLSFTITPIGGQEDYDWQLYDITGLPPNAIFTNTNIIVTGNWAGTYGATGAASNGKPPPIQCGSQPSDNAPTFAQSPNIIEGHEYLLMISHFSDNQSGYSLSFAGGTAVITDPTEPHLSAARAPCDGQTLTIKLNKKIKCNSIAANGSDFSINTGVTTITSATGVGCGGGFDTDSIVLTLSNPLPPGNYVVSILNGVDANTVLDNCDRAVPVGENLDVEVFPIFPTPMDSIVTPGCAPQRLELVFKKPMRCNTISPNGSDFSVTGPYPVNVTAASGNCDAMGFTYSIFLDLDAPMQVNGNFIVTLLVGDDGNTVIDECGQPSTPGATIGFNVVDTVNADFTYNISYGCKIDTINYFHNGANGVNSWQWTFEGIHTSTLQNPTISYNVFGEKTATLIVSNGTCKDSTGNIVLLDNFMKAGFISPDFVCPNDPVSFIDTSIGNIQTWAWDFGNGITSNMQQPPVQSYINANTTFNVTVKLHVTNNLGCTDSMVKILPIINNCFIAVPSAFTPNGDGLNDFLYPLNAYKAKDLEFSVYNRFGQRLFQTRNWLNKWDGNFKGQGADPATYVWTLTYTHADTGQRIEQKGTVILIR